MNELSPPNRRAFSIPSRRKAEIAAIEFYEKAFDFTRRFIARGDIYGELNTGLALSLHNNKYGKQ
jgi:hypothetical protein